MLFIIFLKRKKKRTHELDDIYAYISEPLLFAFLVYILKYTKNWVLQPPPSFVVKMVI